MHQLYLPNEMNIPLKNKWYNPKLFSFHIFAAAKKIPRDKFYCHFKPIE